MRHLSEVIKVLYLLYFLIFCFPENAYISYTSGGGGDLSCILVVMVSSWLKNEFRLSIYVLSIPELQYKPYSCLCRQGMDR